MRLIRIRGAALVGLVNIGFPGVDAAALLATIRDRVACLTGSSCHAGHAAPSPVLLAIGRSPVLAAAAQRLSLGWATTTDRVAEAAQVIGAAVDRLHAGASPASASGG